ncbi:MAG: hypothetical protein P1Q69_07760 [Candidatus Thorarchaeota archaeon]|nr:hypothetical protein [Candidatus Thorarchaeota archaeon]
MTRPILFLRVGLSLFLSISILSSVDLTANAESDEILVIMVEYDEEQETLDQYEIRLERLVDSVQYTLTLTYDRTEERDLILRNANVLSEKEIKTHFEDISNYLMSETYCDLPIVGKRISDSHVNERTSELRKIVDSCTNARIVMKPNEAHNDLVRLLENPKGAFQKMSSLLLNENRSSKGLSSVRESIISESSFDEKLIPFVIAIGEITFMSQQPSNLLQRIESFSLQEQDSKINTNLVISGERLITYSSQLSETENGITVGLEAVRIATNAFLQDCKTSWEEFISIGLKPTEIIHLAFAYTYSKAKEVRIREGGFFTLSRNGEVRTRADIIISTAIEILSRENVDRAKTQDVEEYFLSSTRVAADTINLEFSDEVDLQYAVMTHGFWRPLLKGGRHRAGQPGKYYRSSIKVSGLGSENSIIESAMRSSKVSGNGDLENAEKLIPYFSMFMEYNHTQKYWQPRIDSSIVYLMPSYRKLIGMKIEEVESDSKNNELFSKLHRADIVVVDEGIITLDPEGFEKVTCSFSIGCELEEQGILSSIDIPESIWRKGDQFLISSVEKTRNIDIFERFFKYLSNKSTEETFPPTEVQTDVHGCDYSIDTLETENHQDILIWMKKLRSMNYFANDTRSRMDNSLEKRNELDTKQKELAL